VNTSTNICTVLNLDLNLGLLRHCVDTSVSVDPESGSSQVCIITHTVQVITYKVVPIISF
jgi:hypothetical protein